MAKRSTFQSLRPTNNNSFITGQDIVILIVIYLHASSLSFSPRYSPTLQVFSLTLFFSFLFYYPLLLVYVIMQFQKLFVVLLKVEEREDKTGTKTTGYYTRNGNNKKKGKDGCCVNSKEEKKIRPKRPQVCDPSGCYCCYCKRMTALLRQRTSCSSGHSTISKFQTSNQGG